MNKSIMFDNVSGMNAVQTAQHCMIVRSLIRAPTQIAVRARFDRALSALGYLRNAFWKIGTV